MVAPMPIRFDAIVIGAGQAGPSLAARLTAAGRTVALVERKLFGGTCVIRDVLQQRRWWRAHMRPIRRDARRFMA